MIAARIHLDDSPGDNGALAVIKGTHCRGKLRIADLQKFDRLDYRLCETSAGDVLLMRPLLVHRSSPSSSPVHRRVLHVVYASRQPGCQVRWRNSCGPLDGSNIASPAGLY